MDFGKYEQIYGPNVMEMDKDVLYREAEEVGCFGLVGGWARNLYTHCECHASSCSKSDGPFYCPVCHSDAVVRKCAQKRDHFAHVARLTPVIGPKETELHKACKKEICTLLQNRHPSGNWETEREIRENKDKGISRLVPDISGRINGKPVVIEVQASALTIRRIVKRSRGYVQRGIAILWVVPLYEPLGDLPFRPRLYERYLHSIYYGRTYYWWAGQGVTLRPVHYGRAIRHVEYREWSEGGSIMSGGDYDAEYKIIKTPVCGRDIAIDEDFNIHSREQFVPENERKAVPSCLIWQDNLKSWWSNRK